MPDTPAEAAGLRRGDILTHVNGREILFGQEALNLIAGMPPGDIVELHGNRGGQAFRRAYASSERPSPEAADLQPGNPADPGAQLVHFFFDLLVAAVDMVDPVNERIAVARPDPPEPGRQMHAGRSP